jgi:serine/threonine protein kinase/class 3 adenylate cyclase
MSSDTLKVNRTRHGSAWRVALSGSISESSDLGAALAGLGGAVVIDLGGLHRITSFGVRKWRAAIGAMNADYLCFLNARPAIVSQFNMITGFGGKGELVSLYLPYLCTRCGKDQEQHVDLRRDFEALESGDPAPIRCTCGGEAQLDEIPDSYFQYIRGTPRPSPPASVLAALDGEERPSASGFRVEMDVQDPVTALWMSGRLDNARHLKRRADGLQGEILFVLAEVSSIEGDGLAGLRSLTDACETPPYLARVPVPLAQEISRGCPRGKVISVLIPRKCRSCGQSEPAEASDLSLVWMLADSFGRCPKCTSPLSIDFPRQSLEQLCTLPISRSSMAVRDYLSVRAREPIDEPKPAPATPSLAPTELNLSSAGEYRISRLLGGGRSGDVYLAEHSLIGRQVALKVLRHALCRDQNAVARYMKDARAVNRLRHKHIVEIYSFGQLPEGRHYHVMKLLEGSTLEQQLAERGRLPLPDVFATLRSMAAALEAAHAAGVTHGDLKTSNVFLARGEGGVLSPKLLDFGVGWLLSSAVRPAIPGETLGDTASDAAQLAETNRDSWAPPSPYRSPEQRQGLELDPRSDVYTFGVIAFELLTGRRPIDGDGKMQVGAMLGRLLEPPRPSSINPELPQKVDEILLPLLALDRAKRPTNLSAVVEGLEVVLRSSSNDQTLSERRVSLPPPRLSTIPPPPPSASSLALPIAGRQAERARLRSLVDLSLSNKDPLVVLVMGERGIGKTRLLDELAGMVVEAGGEVHRGRAIEGGSLGAYGIFVEALRAMALEDRRPDLAPLFPEIAPPGHVTDQLRMSDAVAELIQSRAKKRSPLLLLLDDLHWMDDASAALLELLAKNMSGPVIFALGWRGDPRDEGRADLVQALADLGAETMDLGPLDKSSTLALARSVDPTVDVESLYEDSGGNPLFAIEIARARNTRGGGGSETLEELIRERLLRLSERASDILHWAAAIGRSFDLQILAAVSETSAAELLNALKELERRGVIMARAASRGTPGYDFTHDLVRQLAYDAISEPNQQLLHRGIAQALAPALERNEAIAVDVARHALLGGDDELAVRASVIAGERCVRLHAHKTARELADRAREVLPRVVKEKRIGLHIRLLALYFQPGIEPKLAQKLDQELEPLLREASDLRLLDDVVRGFGLRMWFGWASGDLDSTLRASASQIQIGRDLDPAARARALGEASHCLAMVERDVENARAMFIEARTIADRLGSHFWEVSLAAAAIACFDGELQIATSMFEHTLSLLNEETHAWQLWLCHSFLAKIALESGHPSRAGREAAILGALANKVGEPRARAFASAINALARVSLTDPEAEAQFRLALDELSAVDAKADAAYLLQHAARIDFERGRFDRARDWASVSLTLANRVRSLSDAAAAREVLARVALIKGEIDEARAQVAATKRDLDRPGAIRGLVRRRLTKLESELGNQALVAISGWGSKPHVPAAEAPTDPPRRPEPAQRTIDDTAPQMLRTDVEGIEQSEPEPMEFENTAVSLHRPGSSQIAIPEPASTPSHPLRRRLVAVLAADAVGYSRLMHQDDISALRVLSSHRTRMGELVAEHEGRVVDFAGDSMLAEFASTLEAFRCAYFIQAQLERDNTGYLPEQRMSFRIGIHIGDVVAEGAAIYGDGVNIASRLQALAAPGGICISQAVYEQIRLRVPIKFADLGEQTFKNILTPMRAFHVGPETINETGEAKTLSDVG